MRSTARGGGPARASAWEPGTRPCPRRRYPGHRHPGLPRRDLRLRRLRSHPDLRSHPGLGNRRVGPPGRRLSGGSACDPRSCRRSQARTSHRPRRRRRVPDIRLADSACPGGDRPNPDRPNPDPGGGCPGRRAAHRTHVPRRRAGRRGVVPGEAPPTVTGRCRHLCPGRFPASGDRSEAVLRCGASGCARRARAARYSEDRRISDQRTGDHRARDRSAGDQARHTEDPAGRRTRDSGDPGDRPGEGPPAEGPRSEGLRAEPFRTGNQPAPDHRTGDQPAGDRSAGDPGH